MSVFIPSLDPKRTEREAIIEAQRNGYEVVCREQIENGRLGLRMWRVA